MDAKNEFWLATVGDTGGFLLACIEARVVDLPRAAVLTPGPNGDLVIQHRERSNLRITVWSEREVGLLERSDLREFFGVHLLIAAVPEIAFSLRAGATGTARLLREWARLVLDEEAGLSAVERKKVTR